MNQKLLRDVHVNLFISLAVLAAIVCYIFMGKNIPDTLLYLLWPLVVTMLIISYIGTVKGKNPKDKLTYDFTFMTWFANISFVTAIIINSLEIQSEKPEWFTIALFVLALVWSINSVLQKMQNRIDVLEEKLNQQEQPKQQ